MMMMRRKTIFLETPLPRRELSTPAKNRENVVTRIALTGGPCSGKSSALAHIRAKGIQLGFNVYCAPEVANLLFHMGIEYPGTHDKEQEFIFQRSLCRLQLAIEDNLTSIAKSTGRASLVVMDRGLLDAKGYMTPELWERVLGDLAPGGVVIATEEDCLERYEGVVHLVTAANGALDYYKSGFTTDDSGITVHRRETPEEAVVLDQKMKETWKKHPHLMVIPNEGYGRTFQDKLEATSNAVFTLAKHQ
jgi:predicted ATPase